MPDMSMGSCGSCCGVDLHLHSLYSDDGQFAPAELARCCAQAGLRLFSVTDHNTVRAAEEAGQAAAQLGLGFLPGVELDCLIQGVGVHLLGYGVDPRAPGFARWEADIRAQGRAVSAERLEKTRALGFAIGEKELQAAAAGSSWPESWTGELFARLLLAREEYKGHPLLAPYRPGGPRGDNPEVNFYWDYYAQGRPCFAPIEYPPLAEAAELIHQSGGVAVLAHPGVNLRGREGLFEAIAGQGLDGVEAFSSYHTPQQAAYWQAAARAKGLFVSCGSDFHGRTKPAVKIGGHGAGPDFCLPDALAR